MTINEAIEKGIRTVTQEPWKSGNKFCHMILPEKSADGTHGCWAYIVDPAGNLAIGDPAEKQICVLLFPEIGAISADPNVDEWFEWTKPDGYDLLIQQEPYHA
jgi:hypothetical protein